MRDGLKEAGGGPGAQPESVAGLPAEDGDDPTAEGDGVRAEEGPAVATKDEPKAQGAKPAGPVLDDDAALRAALTRKKYADVILKAKRSAFQASATDPKTKAEMERKQREERAKIEAEAKAAQEASRRRAEQAAAAARKKREEEREAERRRLIEMERTVEIDESQRVLKEFHTLGAEPARNPGRAGEDRGSHGEGGGGLPFPGLDAGSAGNALGSFGFELADSEEEDNDEPEEQEEGEI